MKILVVCLGNICRSPTAHAVLRQKAQALGLNIEVDSAGTIAAHAGEQPDDRSMAAGEARGYDFSGIYSRKVRADDFVKFDLILAADKQNLRDLKAIAPAQYQDKLALFLHYGEQKETEIPDPYYGGKGGFELVIDLIEQASDVILQKVAS
ncbi:low molecular weight protein-tyrosine-phosphatase [Motilimonas sp. KMU-193]|uniref:low molecular weight protein-tyrosine-phosphatase n=1 Tax=Motilimonas sp. KMU-193 TaxID=3388668 RepID=UPI00396B33AA